MLDHPSCCSGHSCDRCSVCLAGVCCLTNLGRQLKADLDDARASSPLTSTVQTAAHSDAHGRLVSATARIMSSLQTPAAPVPLAVDLMAEMRAAIEVGVVELRPLIASSLKSEESAAGSTNGPRLKFEPPDASRTGPLDWADGPAGLTTGTSSVWPSSFDAVRRADHQHLPRTHRPTRSCEHKEQHQ